MGSLPEPVGVRVPLRLVVDERRELTRDVVLLALAAPDGSALPGYGAGAHVTVTAPSGRRPSYSLAEGGSAAPRRYVIAVRRSEVALGGRGGSASLHDDVRVGDVLEVTPPRNHFPLLPARRYVLVAGGIGITPVRAMAQELRARGDAAVELLYLTRDARSAPFLEEVTADGAVVHHSAQAGRLDLWPWLAEPDDDARVYCCGPTALLEEVRALTVHWRPSRVHVEEFTGVDATGVGAGPFTAVWEPTGERVDVPADQTMLTALRRAGLPVDGDCEAGTCGTCRLRLVAGEAHHRDVVLDEGERAVAVMPCVSRAAGDELVVAPPPLHLRP